MSFGRGGGGGRTSSSRDTGDRGGNCTFEDDASAFTRRTAILVCDCCLRGGKGWRTVEVGERSMDGLEWSFKEGSADDEDCGDCMQTSDELTDEVAGEVDKCGGKVAWRGDGGMIGSARFGL